MYLSRGDVIFVHFCTFLPSESEYVQKCKIRPHKSDLWCNMSDRIRFEVRTRYVSV